MKKVCLLASLVFPMLLMAQSVAINNDGAAPDQTALLDIKSNSKGLLIPRLSTAQRAGIVSPALGLTVFDTDTYSFWVFRGDVNGGWVQLLHSLDKHWDRTGVSIFNTNPGNVGIGTNLPASKLTINDTDPAISLMNGGLAAGSIQAAGFDMKMNTAVDNPLGKIALGTKGIDHFFIDYLGRVTVGPASDFDAALKLNGSSPRFAFLHNNVQKGIIRLAGDDFKIGTYAGNSGNIVIAPKGVDKIWIDENGRMGIGTATPVSDLTINGVNPYLELQHNNVNTGFLQAVGDDLRLGTNSTNLTGKLLLQTKLLTRMLVDENGSVGIGTSTPSSILTINSTNPILQLRNDNVDKGFVQLVNDDIKIGTNISNTTGKFVVRTKGVDRFSIDEDGYGTFGNGSSGGLMLMNGPFSGITFQSSNLTQGHILASEGSLEIYRANPGLIRIRANSDGMWFYPNGQLSFGGGGQRATGYAVSIEGKAIATEFRVLAIASWPDYVFADGYQLKPLGEVKKFISQHKHLPGIPSAATVEKNGIELGDISKRLMEKVEELTLYIIRLQEQVDELTKK
jgi:hypothetical protein